MKRCTFLVVVPFLCACAGESAEPPGGAQADAGSRADAGGEELTGEHHQFVLSDILIPRDQTEGSMYGMDLDRDGTIDNKFATIIQTLEQFSSTDPQEAMDLLVAHGEVLMLADLQAPSLESAETAGLWVFPGANPTPAPCEDAGDATCGRHLQGDATFEVAAEDAGESLLFGEIASSSFSGGPGQITLETPFVIVPGAFDLDLVAVRVQAELGPGGSLSGKLAGAATVEELEGDLLPQLLEIMNDAVASDCGGSAPDCCTAGSKGELLVDLFDADASCDLTLEEVQESALIQQLLAPDLDRDQDGAPDSVSFGLRFEAVPAEFPFE